MDTNIETQIETCIHIYIYIREREREITHTDRHQPGGHEEGVVPEMLLALQARQQKRAEAVAPDIQALRTDRKQEKTK